MSAALHVQLPVQLHGWAAALMAPAKVRPQRSDEERLDNVCSQISGSRSYCCCIVTAVVWLTRLASPSLCVLRCEHEDCNLCSTRQVQHWVLKASSLKARSPCRVYSGGLSP